MDVQVSMNSDPNVMEGIMGSITHLEDGNGTVLASYTPSISGLQWLHVKVDGKLIYYQLLAKYSYMYVHFHSCKNGCCLGDGELLLAFQSHIYEQISPLLFLLFLEYLLKLHSSRYLNFHSDL